MVYSMVASTRTTEERAEFDRWLSDTPELQRTRELTDRRAATLAAGGEVGA